MLTQGVSTVCIQSGRWSASSRSPSLKNLLEPALLFGGDLAGEL